MIINGLKKEVALHVSDLGMVKMMGVKAASLGAAGGAILSVFTGVPLTAAAITTIQMSAGAAAATMAVGSGLMLGVSAIAVTIKAASLVADKYTTGKQLQDVLSDANKAGIDTSVGRVFKFINQSDQSNEKLPISVKQALYMMESGEKIVFPQESYKAMLKQIQMANSVNAIVRACNVSNVDPNLVSCGNLTVTHVVNALKKGEVVDMNKFEIDNTFYLIGEAAERNAKSVRCSECQSANDLPSDARNQVLMKG